MSNASTPSSPLWQQPIEVLGLTGEYASGKAQPLDAKILTPDGWTRMGDIRPGDNVVNPANGGECRVVGVFPQGIKPVFRIVFSDGAATECCDDHLWLVQTANHRNRGQRGWVIPLSEVRKRHDKCRLWVPLTEPVKFATAPNLNLDPYLLGVLLGNGGLTHSVELSTPDEEIIERIAPLLPAGVKVRRRDAINYRLSTVGQGGANNTFKNKLLNELRRLGVHGKKSIEKSIPSDYMVSSIWDRLGLLQGLCDTDGYAKPGACEYATSSAKLAQQVRELVRSLGGRASIRQRTPHYSYGGEQRTGHLAYRLWIRLPSGMCPFILARKAKVYNASCGTEPTRRIVSINPAGVKECQCIALDSADRLYITDDYIVTHNTLFGLTIAPGPATLCYDNEKSSGTYQQLGFDRIDVPAALQKQFPNGYKPVDTFAWWLSHVRSIPAGKYRVILLDPVSEIESGLVDWVRTHPQEFGRTAAQYAKSSGLMWGDVKEHWKAILADLASRCETFVFTAHMANVWERDGPTGKRKAKGKETLMELASLYLQLERKKDAKGNQAAKPAAVVLKSRLSSIQVSPTGNVNIIPTLPPRLPEATPAAVRRYMTTPPNYAALGTEELAPEPVMTEEEKLELRHATAKAEREAAEINMARVERVQAREQQRPAVAHTAGAPSPAAVPCGPPPILQPAVLPPSAPPSPRPGGPSTSHLTMLTQLRNRLWDAAGDKTDEARSARWKAILDKRGVKSALELTTAQADELCDALAAKLNATNPLDGIFAHNNYANGATAESASVTHAAPAEDPHKPPF